MGRTKKREGEVWHGHTKPHAQYATKLWEFTYTESSITPEITMTAITGMLLKINSIRERHHLPPLTYRIRRPGGALGPIFQLWCEDHPISIEVNRKPHLYALLQLYADWLFKVDDAIASMSEKD